MLQGADTPGSGEGDDSLRPAGPGGRVRLSERAVIVLWTSLALCLGLAAVVAATWSGSPARLTGGPAALGAGVADTPAASEPPLSPAAAGGSEQSLPVHASEPDAGAAQAEQLSGPASIAAYVVAAAATGAVTGDHTPIVVPRVPALTAAGGFGTTPPVALPGTTAPVPPAPVTSAPAPPPVVITPPPVVTTPPPVVTTPPPVVTTPPPVVTTPPPVVTTPPPVETAPPAEKTTTPPVVEATPPAAQTTPTPTDPPANAGTQG